MSTFDEVLKKQKQRRHISEAVDKAMKERNLPPVHSDAKTTNPTLEKKSQ